MPLLSQEPAATIASVDDLLAIALAMEEEAIRRYLTLAERQRGAPDLAALFQGLADEEGRHVAAVLRSADSLLGHAPVAAPVQWHLPPDIARSWEEVEASVRLSPYKALSIAVLNEERAFAFYAYVAAHAATPAVASQAEALAREELRHAAQLRRARRHAYHQERGTFIPLPTADDAAELRALADMVEAELAAAASAQKAAAAERAVDIYSLALDRMADEEGVALAQTLLKTAIERLVSLGNHSPSGAE
ncbi:ferritin family protein [Nitrospirillum viridazoti]|uniref:Rubrerythrin family protein n=1 Tax=Nitrospirillum viridazoti CBAmc TaxID=1441467 RepID=A0A248JZN3_9PROT|nr:ferritin family protein [Nitrospirillum amazonense]ASG24175.1 rubrerythrin family protein [Nitrospirillum amazonense CBAmc]TWB40834.1 rubrerythrin [Nitrospirillum amazonense]